MGNATLVPGTKQVYVRSVEPGKFLNNLKGAVSKAVDNGLNVEIALGGPEKFPSHNYKNKDIGGIKFLIYTTIYWTKMEIKVTGRSDEENETTVLEIIKAMGEQVEAHT